MCDKLLTRSIQRARWLISAARLNLALLLLVTTAQAQIAIQGGSPLAIPRVITGGTAISSPFTVTAGASVMVVILEDRGAANPEPATLTWNGQVLVRDTQSLANVVTVRCLAIYHLYNPNPGTANITGTMGASVSSCWLTAYTLSGVDTSVAPLTAAVDTGSGTTNTSLSAAVNGVLAGSWAAVSACLGTVGYTDTNMATSGTATTNATTVTDNADDSSTAIAGYVAGLSGGTNTFTSSFSGGTKACFAVSVFPPPSAHPVSTVKAFGIKFLGNTTDPVTTTAGVFPISGWNNIANGSYTAGTIYSSDGSVAATLTLSGSGSDNTWNSGAFSDGGNSSLMDGYQDAQTGAPATDVISGLTGAAYNVFLYTGGDNPRPNNGTDYLPNYTINGTTYYTATLKGYDAILQMIQSVPTSQNSSNYPTTQIAGQYLKISKVVPVGGKITITANSDSLTYRSPLNGIELVPVGNVPQVMVQPVPHRLYTGGTAQLQVQAEGANPMAYQWRLNGTNLNDGGNISGSQTTNLTIANLPLTDAGNYDVVITNSYGLVTSSVANLNVVVETAADAVFEAWVAAYVVTNGYQTYIVNSLQNRNFAFMWQQAYMIWMVEDSYDRTQSPDQKQLITALINTFMHQNGLTETWDGWDDDLEWGEMALIRSYETTGNIVALNSAISVWNAVMSRGWDSTFGGGIWEKLPPPTSKCALSNYPQIIAGMHLFQITGQSNYLTTSRTIYDWGRTNLFIATSAQATNGMNWGQVNEGVAWADTNDTTMKVLVSNNSYNSGLFAMAACLLYQATGITQYLSDAILAENNKVNVEPISNENHVNNGDFGGEMLFRGAVLIARQNNYNLWPTYGPWLQANSTAAWGKRRTDLNLTRNDFTSATPVDTNDLDSLETECAVLVQQMTLDSIPGFATNFTLNYGGTPVSQSAGRDWNTVNNWNPTGLSATTAVSGYPGSSFEVVVGSLVRNPAGSVNNLFPGDALQVDGNGNTDFNANPVGVGEIRFKNSTPGIPSTNYFKNLILNGGELNIGDSTDVILQGMITVLTNSAFGTQGGTGTNQDYRVDSYLTGSGTIVLYLTNSTPSAALNITGTTNTFTGQWNILQGPLVGSGANSMGTNNITVGTNGILETTYPINNTNSSLILNGRMFLTQTNAFRSVVVNGTPLPAGTYTAAQLHATNATAFPLTFPALYGTTATSASGAIKVGNVVIPPSTPHITSIQLGRAGGLTLSATNGTPGGSWALLQSTNVAWPLSQWQANATGTFDGGGNLSTNLLNVVTNTQNFYILKVQ
jgi:hypothetical protein